MKTVQGDEMTEALARQEQAPIASNEPSPMQLMQQALASGASPESLQALVTLQQSMERFEWEREERQAKIDFDNALNECQRQIGRIAPNRERENSIMWLDYVGVDKVVRPVYLAAGFSIGYSEVESAAEGRRMCATLSRSGVSRQYFSKLIPSGNSKMSAADLDASGSSRAMRYLLLKIFNIAVGIDKDEKKPFGDAQTMDPAALREWLDKIGLAQNGRELTASYIAALNIAAKVGDTQAASQIEQAANRRKKEL
jgi:hypothetical protein